MITDGQLDCLQQVLYGLILAEKIISTSLVLFFFLLAFLLLTMLDYVGLCWTMFSHKVQVHQCVHSRVPQVAIVWYLRQDNCHCEVLAVLVE